MSDYIIRSEFRLMLDCLLEDPEDDTLYDEICDAYTEACDEVDSLEDQLNNALERVDSLESDLSRYEDEQDKIEED